ncbi:MAG TPA: dihydropteroate synthase [Enterovirga sp.]
MIATRIFRHRTGSIPLDGRTRVMGIVNVTPDSFSDGGRNFAREDAIASAARMTTEGADILDIGGESTRPGHTEVPAEEEWNRLAPVFAALSDAPAPLPPISVDTWKAEVAAQALAAGAVIVNDVWGFQRDPAMASVVAESGAGAILMHNREAIDETIDIVEDIFAFLDCSLCLATKAGIADDRIMLDPGIGFGKTFSQSYKAVAALPRLKTLGFPVLLGLSRKGFIGPLTAPPAPSSERLGGSIAGNVFGALNGADVIRVHDVAPHVQAMRMLDAVRGSA